ncbi:MAG: hypothetical protein E7342_04480 [Clostridiales bacterium]|nr:hypothetical protein [Clostridiales bacterium]
MQKLTKRKIILIILAVIVLATAIAFLCSQLIKEKDVDFEKYYNQKVAEFEAENQVFKEERIEVDVVFIGDSITEGMELDKTPYSDYSVAWRGINGDTTFGLEKRLKVSIYDLNPKVVVMCIGGNNLDTMLDNYGDILADIATNLPETKVIVHSIYPTAKKFADRNQKIQSINSALKGIVNQFALLGYAFVDTNTKVKDVNGEFDLRYTDDGLHPNAEGYKIIANALIPEIDKALYN